jgi:hypothetical protein
LRLIEALNTFSSDLTEFDAMAAEMQPLIDKVWRHCEDTRSIDRLIASVDAAASPGSPPRRA